MFLQAVRRAQAARSTLCADAQLMPDASNANRIDTATLCLVNRVRIEHGLLPLLTSPQLQQAAQRHADDMVAQDYFDHVGPAGDGPLRRVRSSGYLTAQVNAYLVGENIAWGTGLLATPSAIVSAWIASPEHLANILAPGYRDTGLAATPAVPPSLGLGQPGATYTQDFGARSTASSSG